MFKDCWPPVPVPQERNVYGCAFRRPPAPSGRNDLRHEWFDLGNGCIGPSIALRRSFAGFSLFWLSNPVPLLSASFVCELFGQAPPTAAIGGMKTAIVEVVALRQLRPRPAGGTENSLSSDCNPGVAPLNAALLVAARQVPPPFNASGSTGCQVESHDTLNQMRKVIR